jgi:hypothetical protein
LDKAKVRCFKAKTGGFSFKAKTSGFSFKAPYLTFQFYTLSNTFALDI